VRDIIRKILKEQTEVTIPNNKKEYVDKVLKMWETDPMNSKQFVDTYAIDSDMALYIRQKIVEDLKNVPIGKKIWLLDKDFPDIGTGNYDFKFTIDKIIDSFDQNSELPPADEAWVKNMIKRGNVDVILEEEIMLDATIYPEGSVHIDVQEDDGEYELKEFSIYDALNDNDFGWEVESEVKDIIWEYIMSFSPLLNKVRPEIEVILFSPN
jgi:hypothetical protein